jgi:hypothetical protein
MTSVKYIGLDVHKESISICVRNSVGKVVMESVIETKASTILQFIDGLRGDLRVTFEEGTWAAWLYDLLKPHVSGVEVCNPRKNALLKDGSKRDHNHDLKDIFKGAAMRASTAAGPLHDFYENLLAKGRKPTMARLTLARKIAAITLIVWKKEVRFDANYLKPQAA